MSHFHDQLIRHILYKISVNYSNIIVIIHTCIESFRPDFRYFSLPVSLSQSLPLPPALARIKAHASISAHVTFPIT